MQAHPSKSAMLAVITGWEVISRALDAQPQLLAKPAAKEAVQLSPDAGQDSSKGAASFLLQAPSSAPSSTPQLMCSVFQLQPWQEQNPRVPMPAPQQQQQMPAAGGLPPPGPPGLQPGQPGYGTDAADASNAAVSVKVEGTAEAAADVSSVPQAGTAITAAAADLAAPAEVQHQQLMLLLVQLHQQQQTSLAICSSSS